MGTGEEGFLSVWMDPPSSGDVGLSLRLDMVLLRVELTLELVVREDDGTWPIFAS